MLKKNDFVEIEYLGKVKNGGIFDTNIKEEAKKIPLEIDPKPFVICLGQNMILPAIDNFLIGKPLGTYNLDLAPENAFGKRNPDLVKTFPLSAFKNQNTMPHPGMVFYFDNLIGKINSVSGGRVIVDFNNPLAGKPVEYKVTVKKEIKELNEKARALLSFYTKKEFQFKIENKKIIVEATKTEGKIIGFFSKKFKEILDLELEIKEKAEDKKPAESQTSH